MEKEPIQKRASIRKFSMEEKWDLIAEQAIADTPDAPNDKELKMMAKLRGCTVMDLLIEEADRDIAAGRVYPMPLDDDKVLNNVLLAR